jgi:hypothetical protein
MILVTAMTDLHNANAPALRSADEAIGEVHSIQQKFYTQLRTAFARDIHYAPELNLDPVHEDENAYAMIALGIAKTHIYLDQAEVAYARLQGQLSYPPKLIEVMQRNLADAGIGNPSEPIDAAQFIRSPEMHMHGAAMLDNEGKNALLTALTDSIPALVTIAHDMLARDDSTNIGQELAEAIESHLAQTTQWIVDATQDASVATTSRLKHLAQNALAQHAQYEYANLQLAAENPDQFSRKTNDYFEEVARLRDHQSSRDGLRTALDIALMPETNNTLLACASAVERYLTAGGLGFNVLDQGRQSDDTTMQQAFVATKQHAYAKHIQKKLDLLETGSPVPMETASEIALYFADLAEGESGKHPLTEELAAMQQQFPSIRYNAFVEYAISEFRKAEINPQLTRDNYDKRDAQGQKCGNLATIEQYLTAIDAEPAVLDPEGVKTSNEIVAEIRETLHPEAFPEYKGKWARNVREAAGKGCTQER